MITYDERMNVDGLASFSPSARKPRAFHKELIVRNRYAALNENMGVTPVTIDDLKRVHDSAYVDAVFAGTTNNGFGNRDPRVPESCLWTVGSLVKACSVAIDIPYQPVCSPTSGFHHAGYAWGGGYCTFNGLLVAAQMHLDKHPSHTVGIIDCDVHYGDGTADILRHMPALAERVVHRTSGQHFNADADRFEFFAWLNESINAVNEAGCQLVIYQAGADMHKDDPLGGFLDDADMAARDRRVFDGIHGAVVWNLAGGYRPSVDGRNPVVETHIQTHGRAHAASLMRQRRHEARNLAGAPDHPAQHSQLG